MVKYFHSTVYPSTATKVFVLLTALLCSAARATPTTPTESLLLPYKAQYRISHDGLNTTAERQLQRDGDHWKLSQTAKLFFLRVEEETVVERHNGQLRPLRYRYENNLSSKQNQQVLFDWQRGLVSDTKASRPWQQVLKSDYSDQLSSQLQLREMLMNNQLQGDISQTIVKKKGKLKTYQIQRLGNEHLDTAIGPLDTVKLRRHRQGSSSESFIWVAPQLNYLIVKLEQHEDDELYTLDILSANITTPGAE
ncbi:DUF3108 domain-containing protein [Spongiibacter sp.]|uniref:DUF3108 domain-containing protein n=1 Tax=Spongiibacter sp. TaxID=2024860 RepID=UPI0035620F58